MSQKIPSGSLGLDTRAEFTDWNSHWSAENQHTLAQRFFSFYRKTVFARTVHYFVERYFPVAGIFLEAGSGTSETSMRINTHNGARQLVALDLVAPVLERGHPVMHARVCGDIFQLPFSENSLDGIWNVGVMEHFTHSQIDQILHEFHRALKPGGRLIMLWPGADSIPQRMLRILERVINARARTQPFRFHPPEISQIQSSQQSRDILNRNEFHVLEVEPGPRSLMAFKTLVGIKPGA
jgi:SAM-dependent methyltransferase